MGLLGSFPASLGVSPSPSLCLWGMEGEQKAGGGPVAPESMALPTRVCSSCTWLFLSKTEDGGALQGIMFSSTGWGEESKGTKKSCLRDRPWQISELQVGDFLWIFSSPAAIPKDFKSSALLKHEKLLASRHGTD